MTDQHLPSSFEMSLSALMDGESDDLELQRVLRRLPEDAECRATWARYQLASSLVRGDRAVAIPSPDFADKVRTALADEDPASHRAMPAWKKSVASLAVAASFAALVVGFQGEWTVKQSSQVASAGQAAHTSPSLAGTAEKQAAPVIAGALLVNTTPVGNAMLPLRPLEQQTRMQQLAPVAFDLNGALLPPAAERPVSAR